MSDLDPICRLDGCTEPRAPHPRGKYQYCIEHQATLAAVGDLDPECDFVVAFDVSAAPSIADLDPFN